MALDTSDEARQRHDELFRTMTPEERVAMAMEMSEAAFRLVEDGVRLRHPDYSAEQVRHAALRLRLGDALFAAAFPQAPLLTG